MNPEFAFLYVNGIRVKPGDTRNWNSRAVTWTHTEKSLTCDSVAEEIEYYSGIIPWDRRNIRAKRLSGKWRQYAQNGRRVVIGAHSNGNRVALHALRITDPRWKIHELHMICAACDADFNTNGLNAALATGRINRIYVYIAGRDKALPWAHSVVGKIFWGRTALGLQGPINLCEEYRNTRVFIVDEGYWKEFGHSDCMRGDNFYETMRMLTGAAKIIGR